MTNPFTLEEQQNNNWFRPKHRVAIIFGMSKFDACWNRGRDGQLKQAFADLDTVKQDCKIFKECLLKYEFMEHEILDLSNDPDLKTVTKVIGDLSTKIRKGKRARPVENYLIIFLFAGHGILKDGVQHLLYNEYDTKTQFYKLFAAEKKLRAWSE